MLTLKICVGVFSGIFKAGIFKARMLKLGIHRDNELLYHGIENRTPCAYSSLYYTPGIYVEGYILFVFRSSVHMFVCYTPGIYAAGYIVALTFVRSYVRSLVSSFVLVFVRSLLSVTFVEFTSKFLVKVSLSEYISLTTHQKAFIFEPWVPERVSFYTMSFCPRVDAPGWG